MTPLPDWIPLFPLDVVLMPGRRMPLHIFEPRYRQMVSECIENGSLFGMVRGSDDDFSDIGCAGTVSELLHRFPDGRMNIIALGTQRFRVVERMDDRPYITARIEPYEEDESIIPDDLGGRVVSLYHEALRRALGWYTPPKSRDTDYYDLSFEIASRMQLTAEEQQVLLELTSTRERLQAEEHLLELAIEEMKKTAREMGGNGHVSLN